MVILTRARSVLCMGWKSDWNHSKRLLIIKAGLELGCNYPIKNSGDKWELMVGLSADGYKKKKKGSCHLGVFFSIVMIMATLRERSMPGDDAEMMDITIGSNYALTDVVGTGFRCHLNIFDFLIMMMCDFQLESWSYIEHGEEPMVGWILCSLWRRVLLSSYTSQTRQNKHICIVCLVHFTHSFLNFFYIKLYSLWTVFIP